MGYENSGRRPNPNRLKVLRGITRKDRLNPNEPVPVGNVEKPTGLSSDGAMVWDELAPVCIQMGTLSVADVRPFRMMCELQANLDRAAMAKNEPGNLDKVRKIEKDFAPIIRQYYALFGLDPMSRARMSVRKDAPVVDKWAAVK